MNIYSLLAVIVVSAAAVWIALTRYSSRTVTGTANAGKEVLLGATNGVKEVLGPISKSVAGIGAAIAKRIEQGQVEMDELRTSIIQLTREIERLKSQRISVDQITPIFQVAWAKVDLTHYHFQQKMLKTIPQTTMSQKEEVEYLAVTLAKYSQKLGVDVEKLRFQFSGERTIAVSGLGNPEVVGINDIEIKTLHSELRRHLTKGTLRPDSHQILTGDPEGLMSKEQQAQLSEVLREVNQKAEVKAIDEALDRMALAFLEQYFAPAGFRVLKANGKLADGKTLSQMCEEINRGADSRILHNDSVIKEMTAQLRAKELALSNQVVDECEKFLPASKQSSPID